jgi:hypothetical protein
LVQGVGDVVTDHLKRHSVIIFNFMSDRPVDILQQTFIRNVTVGCILSTRGHRLTKKRVSGFLHLYSGESAHLIGRLQDSAWM